MKLFIDESDGESMFVSVPTKNEKEDLSFDWTRKGHRVMVQKLITSGLSIPERKPDGEWDTLMIEDGSLIGKEHNVWFDYDKEDLINGEKWLMVSEWPIEEELARRMRGICHAIILSQDNLEVVAGDIRELEDLVRQEADRVGVKLAS